MTTQNKTINSQSIEEMTKLYNSLVPKDKRVTKFRDKATAQLRLQKVLDEQQKDKNKLTSKTNMKPSNAVSKTIPIGSPSTSQRVVGEISEDKKNITLDLTVTESRGAEPIIKLVGKKSKLAGKFLYKTTNKNPRRAGSHGWQSFEALKDGMTYEQFVISKGGAKHLQWDIEHGFVEALDKPRTAADKAAVQ